MNLLQIIKDCGPLFQQFEGIWVNDSSNFYFRSAFAEFLEEGLVAEDENGRIVLTPKGAELTK